MDVKYLNMIKIFHLNYDDTARELYDITASGLSTLLSLNFSEILL